MRAYKTFKKSIVGVLGSAINEVDGLSTAFDRLRKASVSEVFGRVGAGIKEFVLHGTAGLNKLNEIRKAADDAVEALKHDGKETKDGQLLVLPGDTAAPIKKKPVVPPGIADAKKSEYDSLKKEAEDFYKSIQQIKEDAENISKTDDQKELAALEKKFADMQKKAEDFFKKNLSTRGQYNEETKVLTEAFNSELAALQKKYFSKISATEYDQALNNTKDYFDDQRNLAGKSYAAGTIDKEQYSEKLKQLDLSEKAQRLTVAGEYSANVKKAAQDVHDFKKDLEKATTQNEIDESEERTKNAEDEAERKKKAEEDAAKAAEELIQRRIRAAQELAQSVVDITGNFLNTLSNLDTRALQKDKAINDAKKNNYKKQLDAKLISQKQYDKLTAKADEELEKKKRELDLKSFKRQQALSITTALINGALAVTSTLAARPGLSDLDTFGISRAVQVALVIAATAAQVAAIATQAPPEAAEGNWFRKGPKHKDPEGGIPVMIERDEAVVKAATMTDSNTYTVTGTPSQITSKLNSMHGGVNWSAGALITSPKFRQPPPQINVNMPRIMARGGRWSGDATSSVPSINNSESNNRDLYQKMLDAHGTMIDEIQKMRNDIRNQNSELQAVVSLKDFRRKEKLYDDAKRSAGMSQ